MVASTGLPESLQAHCREVAYGRCFCGLAAVGAIAPDQERRCTVHQTLGGTTPEHGHLWAPVHDSAGRLLGLLNAYVEPGHVPDQDETLYLSCVAGLLAGLRRQVLSARRRPTTVNAEV
jgi:hypothetical protein